MVVMFGMLLVCNLSLVLCWKLFSGLGGGPLEEQISAVLVPELINKASPLRLWARPEGRACRARQLSCPTDHLTSGSFHFP